MATGGFKQSPGGKNATFPPRRGRIMGLILEDLMMQKGKAANFVPRRGMIKVRILEDLLQNPEDAFGAQSGYHTSPVPRRGMIKRKILEDFVQMLVFPTTEK